MHQLGSVSHYSAVHIIEFGTFELLSQIVRSSTWRPSQLKPLNWADTKPTVLTNINNQNWLLKKQKALIWCDAPNWCVPRSNRLAIGYIFTLIPLHERTHASAHSSKSTNNTNFNHKYLHTFLQGANQYDCIRRIIEHWRGSIAPNDHDANSSSSNKSRKREKNNEIKWNLLKNYS